MEVTANTRYIRRPTGDQAMLVVTLTVETPSYLFDATISPDGTTQFAVNNKPVEFLPRTPGAAMLKRATEKLKPQATALLNALYDSPEYRTKWHELQDLARGIK